jgi:hypothetical protein
MGKAGAIALPGSATLAIRTKMMMLADLVCGLMGPKVLKNTRQ